MTDPDILEAAREYGRQLSVIDVAAQALRDAADLSAFWDDEIEARRVAQAVLAAVTPLIRAAALEEFAVVLKEAELQIEYLHERFGRTGSGEAVLSRIRALKDQP